MSAPACIQPPAQRVVTLAPVLADYTTIDGGGEHILATARPNLNNSRELIWAQLHSSILLLPLTGLTVDPGDPEIYLKLHPDAVFSWAHFSEALRQVGLSSLVEIRFSRGDQNSVREKLSLLGEVSGKNDRTEQLIEQWSQQLLALQQRIATAHPPVVRVAILNGGKDAWWVAGGKGFYLNGSLAFAGARNAAERQSAEKSSNDTLESLIQLDPDLILLNTDPVEGVPRDLFSASAYDVCALSGSGELTSCPLEGCELVDDPVRLTWMAVFIPAR